MELPFVGEHSVIRRAVIQRFGESQCACFCLASLHIPAQHLLDASWHRARHVEHDVMVVWHHLVSEDLYLWAELQHPLLLMDECPSDSRLFHLSVSAIVGKGAEEGTAAVGDHGHMHDAWFSPRARLQPGEGLGRVRGGGGGGVSDGHDGGMRGMEDPPEKRREP